MRHPAPAQGRRSARRCRRGIDVHTMLAAGRRRRRHHAVQLPGDGPALDAGQRDRVRQRVRPEAVGEGPVGVAAPGRAGAAAPASPTASSTSCRATPKRSTRCSTHPDVDAVSFVGSTAGRAPRVRDRHARTASGCRRSAARRTTWSCCPTPTSTPPPTPRSPPAYGSAGERCMAISVVVAVGPVADPLVDAIAARIPDVVGRSRRRRAVDDGPAHHRCAPRPGRGRYVDGAADEGAQVVADGPAPPRLGDGFFLGLLVARPRRRRACVPTTTRSSDRC